MHIIPIHPPVSSLDLDPVTFDLIKGRAATRQSTSNPNPESVMVACVFRRQTVAAADGGPGSAGRRPALRPPDGAVEALLGEALLQLEVQFLVPVQVRGLTLCLLVIGTD